MEEETVQYIVQDGKRVAFFDASGVLHMMREATAVDRRGLFNYENSDNSAL